MDSKDHKYKNSSGTWYTRALFLEERLEEDKERVLYTLKDNDYLGYPSIKRLYLSCLDQSEYSFSVSHLGGWPHWEKIRDAQWFKPYLESWRRELSARLASLAELKILELVSKEGPTAFSASKYLLERAEKVTGGVKRGRPSKGSVPDEILHQRASEAILADFDRLRGIQ